MSKLLSACLVVSSPTLVFNSDYSLALFLVVEGGDKGVRGRGGIGEFLKLENPWKI